MANDVMEIGDFLTYKPTMPDAIVSSGLMYTGSRMIVYGKYKSLKSMLAARFAIAVSRGESWLGFDTIRGGIDTMYLQLEIPNPMLQDRLKKMTLIPSSNIKPGKLWIWTQHSLKIDTQEGYDLVDEMLTKYKPKVLIIDPIYKIVSGDLLSTIHIQKLVDWIDMLVDKHGLSILLVHHTRKGAYEEWGSDDMLGSVIFSAWADTICKVERQQDKHILVKFDVVRHATEEIEPRHFEVDLNTLSFTQNSNRTI